MEREFDLAFIKLHILYHAAKEEIYGIGMIEELDRHGYRLSPGTLYPTLAKMENQGLLTSSTQTMGTVGSIDGIATSIVVGPAFSSLTTQRVSC